jgi:UDP-galactopyranose mutase
MAMYDFIIVGSGFFGSTFARLATDAGKSCLVIDKEPYIGGMTADTKIHGYSVCRHGAHIFHTHNEQVWNFVQQFGAFNSFTNRVKAMAKGKLYSFPINLMTFHQLWGTITPVEALDKLKQVRIPCETPKNAEEWLLSMVGRELYELFFYGYTKKQWHCEPSKLPPSIVARLPIRLTYDDNYFTTDFQGMPKDGYTSLVNNMLSGIRVELDTDFFNIDWRRIGHRLVYTGPIDRFYNYCYGKLDYNTLKFETKVYQGDHQGNAVINYCDEDHPYIRSIEHKHFEYPSLTKHYRDIENSKTVVTYDLPATYEETQAPYYPIQDERNMDLYNRYKELGKMNPEVIFGGRLGEYRYYDLDQTMASAMQKAKKALE